MNAPDAREASALEAMTHLKQKICLMWGSPELDVFISRLMMDSRDGARQGLPMEVGAELLFLAKTNKIIRAIDVARSQKIPLRNALLSVEDGDQKRLESDNFDNPLAASGQAMRERGTDRRDNNSRATRREDTGERRSGQDRRKTGDGATAAFGKLIFSLVTSKAVLFLIAAALTIKLLWPYFSKTVG